jgi:hypothetical protein
VGILVDVALRYTSLVVVRDESSVQGKEQKPVSALQAAEVERSVTISVQTPIMPGVHTSNFALLTIPERTAVSM